MTSNIASKSRLVLAIEAAVRGGSIALIENDSEIAAWHGTADVSRAEDLLSNIADVFDRTQIEKNRVDLIAVSNGPGSYTGIRIGLATALGLARALNIECVGVPLLPAIAEWHRKGTNCVVVIPIGRSELCWQSFKASDELNSFGSPLTGSIDDFLNCFDTLSDFDLLVQRDAYETLAATAALGSLKTGMYDCGRDLALSIGLSALNKRSDLNPNYVRSSKFSSGPA